MIFLRTAKRTMFLLRILGGAVVLLVWGARAGVAETKPLRLGCSLSLSGRQGQSGALYRRAYELAVALVNESGGVAAGGESRPLELVVRDDASDPAQAAAIYEEFIGSGTTDLLLGPFGTAQSVAAARVAGLRGVPIMISGGASEEIFQAGGGMAFGLLPDGEGFSAPLFAHLARRDPRPTSLALVHARDRFYGAVASGARGLAAAAGMALVVDHAYDLGRTAREPLLREIVERKPSVVLIAGHEDEARALVKGLREEGFESTFCLTAGVMERDFRKTLGKWSEGVLGIVPWDPVLDLRGGTPPISSSDFAARFREAFDGEEPDYHAAAAAAAVVSLAAAVERAGGPAWGGVARALRELSLPSFYGVVAFGAQGRQRGGTFLVRMHDGEVGQVAPPRGEMGIPAK